MFEEEELGSDFDDLFPPDDEEPIRGGLEAPSANNRTVQAFKKSFNILSLSLS